MYNTIINAQSNRKKEKITFNNCAIVKENIKVFFFNLRKKMNNLCGM